MDALTQIGERKIAEAIAAGALDDLAGVGKPLPPDDLAGVPADLRASVILLRTAGLLPPHVELRQELLQLDDLLRACLDEEARERVRTQARGVRVRLALLLDHVRGNAARLDYEDALLMRLGGK